MVVFLPLGMLLLFYMFMDRVRMTFARLSTLSGYAYQLRRDKCNSIAFLSACSVADHSNPWTLDPLYPLR